ncbi:MAG: hypothetical protein AB4426_29065 [Xenococcaceae cyanobacterium]
MLKTLKTILVAFIISAFVWSGVTLPSFAASSPKTCVLIQNLESLTFESGVDNAEVAIMYFVTGVGMGLSKNSLASGSQCTLKNTIIPPDADVIPIDFIEFDVCSGDIDTTAEFFPPPLNTPVEITDPEQLCPYKAPLVETPISSGELCAVSPQDTRVIHYDLGCARDL